MHNLRFLLPGYHYHLTHNWAVAIQCCSCHMRDLSQSWGEAVSLAIRCFTWHAGSSCHCKPAVRQHGFRAAGHAAKDWAVSGASQEEQARWLSSCWRWVRAVKYTKDLTAAVFRCQGVFLVQSALFNHVFWRLPHIKEKLVHCQLCWSCAFMFGSLVYRTLSIIWVATARSTAAWLKLFSPHCCMLCNADGLHWRACVCACVRIICSVAKDVSDPVTNKHKAKCMPAGIWGSDAETQCAAI